MPLKKNKKALHYRFLSQTMAYPDNNFLENLSRMISDNDEILNHLSPMINELENENLQKLQEEYTRLFISGYPKTPCPPYESAYIEGRLMGEANTNVLEIYRQWNMTVEAALADHLATELEFLAFLSAAENLEKTKEEANKAFNRFLKNHLKKWLLQFSDDLKNNTEVKFYRLLAEQLLFIVRVYF